MGNFKPPRFKAAQIVPRPNGSTKIILREDEDTLALLAKGYWLEQNILQPQAIWFKHHSEWERPNISWNTFDKLLNRKYIKEAGTLHPIARFTITKIGERAYAKQLKLKEAILEAPPMVPPDMDVTPKPEKKLAAPSTLEKKLKESIEITGHNTFRVGDAYVLNVVFKDHLQLLKAQAMLGLTKPPEPAKEKPEMRSVAFSFSCTYCKLRFNKDYKKTPKKDVWNRHCDNCAKQHATEYSLFKQAYGRAPTPADSYKTAS